MSHSPELQAALDAAEKAADIARSLYQRNIEIRIKADKSPVTEADVRCELAIREILEARFPAPTVSWVAFSVCASDSRADVASRWWAKS